MTHPSGIICPLLTPFEADGSIARDLWLSHAHAILDQGAHFLSPFGSTGEALSVSMGARMQALDWLIEGGIPAEKLMPGTGLTALDDTATLTRHAVKAGCAGVMTLPAFFFPGLGDAGQSRYFRELIAAVDDPRLKLILYHIPQNSGTPVSPALAGELARDFPQTVVAYKDSAGDFANTQAVIDAAPDMAVFPGSESFLAQGMAAGGAGCISATVNVNASAIRTVYDGLVTGRDMGAEDAAMKDFRAKVQAAGLIGGMKAMLAVRSGDQRWLNLRAPHLNTTLEAGEALLAALGPAADHIGA